MAEAPEARATGTMAGADRGGRKWVVSYLAVTGITLILLMVMGIWMRLAQAGWADPGPALFYQLMTAHGTGMVGIAALGGVAVMWHFASRHIRLHHGILALNLALFLLGVVAILVADFIGGFGGGWTFLYPLPALSASVWPTWAAGLHLIGLLLVGVGFLIVSLELGRALIAGYGGIGRALGWPMLFRGHQENLPPPAIVATAMVVIVNTASLTGGAIAIIMNLVNLYVPAIEVDALWMKNLTYFFGHVFVNSTIYMGVIAVYELLPRITGRPWGTSRPFLAAWTVSTTMVLIIYPHHLLMDFAMPFWAMALGQVFSYINSFPVLIVTGLGALAILNRSGIKWDIVPALLLLSMFGWMAGVIPAVIDATIAVNSVMHNTMWVPGHFHFYLLLGLLPMIFAMMIHLARGEDLTPQSGDLMAILYLVFGLGFVVMFLAGGWGSVPRRWAQHLPEWQLWDRIASLMAIGVTLITTVFVVKFLARLPEMLRKA